jgi:AraC family transcriptional regulator
MNTAVERAIRFIRENYSEPLSLDDIAGSAIMSRFHFCRVFAGATGVTPGRFLSAIRIYEAKRMLLNTVMNVTDISFAVGFNSLGSFSNHFTDSVGISPGRFRRVARTGGLGLRRTPVE